MNKKKTPLVNLACVLLLSLAGCVTNRDSVINPLIMNRDELTNVNSDQDYSRIVNTRPQVGANDPYSLVLSRIHIDPKDADNSDNIALLVNMDTGEKLETDEKWILAGVDKPA